MNAFHCPNGCGPLDIYLSRHGRRSAPYTGCGTCGWTDRTGTTTTGPFTDTRATRAYDADATYLPSDDDIEIDMLLEDDA